MKFYLQKKVLTGFIAAISIVTWLSVYSYITNRKFKATSQWVGHAREVLFYAEQLLSSIIQTESAERGYYLSSQPEYFGNYKAASTDIKKHIAKIEGLTAGYPSQRERLLVLSSLIDKKLALSEKMMFARQSSLENPQTDVSLTTGNEIIDAIKQQIKIIQEEEERVLRAHGTLYQEELEKFNQIFVMLLASTAIILILVFAFLHVNLKKRNEAEQSLLRASARIQDIYDHAPCGYHAVNEEGFFEEMNQTWLRWLQYSKDEVIGRLKFTDVVTSESAAKFHGNFISLKRAGFINDVEYDMLRKDGTTFPVLLNATAVYDERGNFIKSRSTVFNYAERKKANEKINQLNRELEAFTYSVSHDLRAPLRSIDGYTRILSEDYGSELDDEGKRILNIIISNAHKMGQLIDDLLDFSHTGRKEILKTKVDVERLVRTVFAEITEGEKSRVIRGKIGALAACLADPGLLRQVWINLVANAVKYSRRQTEAIISISSHVKDKEIIYSIQDNGTGFDMQYVHKLFGVFQRLHREQDFEGTGVGLAIVHRIVSRHGGRIWAEAGVNKGATFYFTIPHEVIIES